MSAKSYYLQGSRPFFDIPVSDFPELHFLQYWQLC